MNDRLKHFKSLPRRTLQKEIRRFIGDQDFYLWEFVGINWMYTAVRAGKQTAAFLGVPDGTVIGYHVGEGQGHAFGGAMGDLMNVQTTAAPYPDPFV